MRYLTVIIFSFLCFQISSAQIYEVGGYLGGSNLIGDVGSTSYISPNNLAFGGIVKWNRSPRHSWRASIIFTTLEAFDSKSDDPRRIQRDYHYQTTNFFEISAGMEFTFWDFNLHHSDVKGTPYLYTGVTIAHHDNYYFNNGQQTFEENTSWAYGIPIVLGYKTTLTDKIIIGLELGARYTFSDELDGSVPDSEWLIENYSFGNLNNNDWYMFTGVTLTYTFGRNDCYCAF